MAASRRGVLKAGIAGMTALAASASKAQTLLAQTEWTEGFDVTSPAGQSAQSSRPSISGQSGFYTEQAISQYSSIATQGGWPQVSASNALRIGMDSPVVPVLRQRLMITGDLDQSAGVSTAYDSFVDGAVRRFQTRHGIIANGVVDDATLRQHMHSLQSIDHITQAQLAVADILRSNLDPDARVDAVVLESLAANIRSSLDRYRQTRPDVT